MSGPSPRLVVGGLAGAAGLVASTTLLSRVLGLGRWAVFADSVGATCLGQVYASANLVPNVLYEVAVGGALAAVAVPVISRFLAQDREGEADRTACALLTWTLTLLVPLTLVLALAADPVAALLLGATGECTGTADQQVAALMLVVFSPQLLLYGVGVVLTGILAAHRRFLAAALAPVLSSLVVIVTYLLFARAYDATGPVAEVPRHGVLLLAVGTTVGVVVMSLPLLVPTWRAGVRLRPAWRFPAGVAAQVRGLALAGAAAVGAQQVVVLVSALAGNRTGAGVVNVLAYVQALYLLPYAVLVVPLATVAFPRLTAPAEATRVLTRATRAVVVGGLLGGLGLVAVRREIGTVFLALDAGAQGVGREALLALPVAVAAWAPGLPGLGLAALHSRALYAVGSPGRAARALVLGWVVAGAGPALVLAGLRPGLGGSQVSGMLALLGISWTAGMTLTAVLLVRGVRSCWGVRPLAGSGRLLTAVGGSGAAVLVLRELLSVTGVLPPEPGWPAALGVAAVTGLLLALAMLAAVAVVDPTAYRAVSGVLLRRRGGG